MRLPRLGRRLRHHRRGSQRQRRSGDVLAVAEPRRYRERTEITLLGRRLQLLDLSREISPDIPVYPGHMQVAIWDHLTHADSSMRMGETSFRGYVVKGLSLCDHDS